MNLNTKTEWIKTQLQLPSSSETTLSLSPLDFDFFHIQEITYEDESPRREAFENVLGSLRLEGINFVYLILGNKTGISFYFGVAKNRKQLEVDIDDIANQILRANIEGNFRGSRVERLRKPAKLELQNRVQSFSYVAQVSGVPELNEEAEQFQGIDRLVAQSIALQKVQASKRAKILKHPAQKVKLKVLSLLKLLALAPSLPR